MYSCEGNMSVTPVPVTFEQLNVSLPEKKKICSFKTLKQYSIVYTNHIIMHVNRFSK